MERGFLFEGFDDEVGSWVYRWESRGFRSAVDARDEDVLVLC